MKKEFPFMPFYTQDWLADDKVSAYSYEEKGVYHEILVYLWQSDTASLPDDNTFLARLLKLSPRKFLSLRSVLIDGQFSALHSIETPDGPRIVQDRLTAEWQKARAIKEKRAEAGSKGGKQKASKTLANAKPSYDSATANAQANDSKTLAYNKLQATATQDIEPGAETPSESPGFSVSPSLRSGATPPQAEGEAVDNSVDNTERPQDDAVSPDSPAESERPEKAEEPTNHAIIRELTAEYRAVVDPQQYKPSDWGYMGQIYMACGVEAVKVGIEELAEKLTRGTTVAKPLPYVGTVARRIAHTPVSARNGHGSRDRPVAHADPEPGSDAWYDALPDGPDSWEILRQDWQEHGGDPA